MTTEWESILLRKLAYSGEFFGKAVPIINSEYFTDMGNQELFKLMKEYYRDYTAIPSLTELVAKVRSVSNAELRSEVVKSLRNVNDTEEVKNMDFMLDETVTWVRDAMYLEALRIGSDGLMKKDDVLKKKAQKIMDDMVKVSIDTDLGLDFDDIDAMIAYYQERNIGVRTQHKELNKRIGSGFLPGTLSVILAASGIGKSLLMSDLISGMIQNGKNILMISLEMSDKENMKRVHANVFNLPINDLSDLNKTEGELNRLDRDFVSKDQIVDAYNKVKITGKCGRLFIKDYPSGTFTPLMLEQLVDSYRIEKGVEFDVIFLDYLGIMASDLLTPAAGLYSYVKSIVEETRSIGKKLKLPIISASQLNRSAVNNVDDADNSAVSDSMGTVMTADFMLFLLQNDEMKEAGEMALKCTKNRFTGRTDTWMMNIDYTRMRFADMVVKAPTNIDSILDTQSPTGAKLDDDFGIVTAEKQLKAEKFVEQEIKDILQEDIQKLKKSDPFNTDLDSLYKDLGLE